MFNNIPLKNKCIGMSAKGKPCKCNAKVGYHYCNKHRADNEPILCQHQYHSRRVVKYIEFGTLCNICQTHLCHQNYAVLLGFIRDEVPIYWQNNLDFENIKLPELIIEAQLPELYIRNRVWEIALYINIFTPSHRVIHRTELARLSHDGENVHTTEVNKQTTACMDKLLSVHIPVGIKPVEELKIMFPKKKKMVEDMKKWYKTKTCINKDDQLYKKLLDGLWKMIHDSSHKDELIKRLCEEATESIGKCCQGHLSRLCNVMVGFDDDFKPEIPVGELLQQQMSAISQKDITTCQKVLEAWKVMDELKIPLEERDAWIEAL